MLQGEIIMMCFGFPYVVLMPHANLMFDVFWFLLCFFTAAQ